MKQIRSFTKGLIFTSSLLLIAGQLHAYGMQGLWGTGFSGGMGGCMADTSAYGGASDEIRDAVDSQSVVEAAIGQLKRAAKKSKAEIKKLKRSKESLARLLSQKPMSKKWLGLVEERAKQVGVSEVDINEDGLFTDIEGDGFDADSFLNDLPACPERDLSSNQKSIQDAIDSFDQACKAFSDESGQRYTCTSAPLAPVMTGAGSTACVPPSAPSSPFDISPSDGETYRNCLRDELPNFDIPSSVDYGDYASTCSADGLNYASVCEKIERKGLFGESDDRKKDFAEFDCEDELETYFELVKESAYQDDLQKALAKQLKKAKKNTRSALKETEGDACLDCIAEGGRIKRSGPSTTQTVVGALAGLTGQYLGLRAYKSAQNNAIDTAAQLGHTMNPIPNFNLYSGLGLSAISAISGLASGAHLCAGTGQYGGVHGMNNPYAMQMAMMGQGGARGYNFGHNQSNPMMGMYMPGNFGGMGPMGLQTPFHMQGQMHPALMAGMGPYASMMGPQSQFNPMAGLGIAGMAGFPGAQFGAQGSFNPYGTMSPYAMMSPFGGASAMAGMGPFSMNPYQMMNPSLYGGAGGLMSCIQAPCSGQLYNPFGMGGGISGGIGLGGNLGLGGLGGGFGGGLGIGGGLNGGLGGLNPQFQQQQIQMQMQMLQQQQQQQQAYYQQIQQQTQQRLQASQQLTQLQQQMAQLNQQAAQISAQAGIGSGFGGGLSGGLGLGLPGLGISGGLNLGFGLQGQGSGMLWGGFPYGPGQISPNAPVANRGNNTR